MKRALLVVPPFHSLTTPALSISLLKALLDGAGVPSDVLYLNLRFGKWIGRDLYDRLASNARALTGDWLFTPAIFGSPLASDADYVETVLRQQLSLGADDVAQLKAIRARTVRFLLDEISKLTLDDYGVTVACADLAVGEDRVQSCPSLAFMKMLKLEASEITTILGGANCQGEMGAAIHRLFPFIDYACSGEMERMIPPLVEDVLTGVVPRSLAGVRHRQDLPIASAGTVFPVVQHLDDLPTPDFDDYFQELQDTPIEPQAQSILVFETSRGCWWGEKHHCTFCGLNGAAMSFRSKSPDRALEELDRLVVRHGVRRVFATDMIIDPRYFGTFLARLAERPLPPSIFFETKANLSRAQLEILARAGVREFQPGVESLSTPILRIMEKGVTAIQNVRLLKWCAELGLEPFWNILYGFPDEEPAEYDRLSEMIPLLEHLPAPYRMLKIRLDRFSPNFEQAANRGLINVRPAFAYKLVYPFETDDLAELAYYFDFDYADGRDPDAYTCEARLRVAQWQGAKHRARLEYRFTGDTLVISDTRPMAARPEVELHGAMGRAYLALDAGNTPERITRALGAGMDIDPPSLRTLTTWLERWTADGLVLRDGDTFLSLAIDPTARIPTPAERLMSMLGPQRDQ